MFSILDLLVNVSYVFFIGLFFLFHRSIVGISCFVGLMCVGVKWMYGACVSQILSVKFHI